MFSPRTSGLRLDARQSNHKHFRNATRSFFSSSVSFVSRIRLKNSTVSSSVSSRPSCKYGGVSLMPRSGNVLIGPSLGRRAAVDRLRLVEALDLQVVHRVVGVVRGRVAGRALGLAEEQRLAAHSRVSVAFFGSSLPSTFELRGRREVEQVLELGHEVDLAAAFQRVDALARGRRPWSPSKYAARCSNSVKSSIDLQGPLRAEQPLDVHAAQAAACRCGGGAPAAGCRRPGASRAFVWPLTWQSKQVTPAARPSRSGGRPWR